MKDIDLEISNPKGKDDLTTTEYQLVPPKSWGSTSGFYGRYHKEHTKADQAAVTAGVDAIKSGVAKTMTGIYYNNGTTEESAFKEVALLEVGGAMAASIAIAAASSSFLFF